MQDTDIVDDSLWLDDVFAKGSVCKLTAACALAGFSKEDVTIDSMFPETPCGKEITSHKVSKMYSIVKTWSIFLNRAPFLRFLEEAVAKDVRHVAYDLLFQKCMETEYRLDQIANHYPELAKALKLKNKSSPPRGNIELKERIIKHANEESARLQKEEKKKKISQHEVSVHVVKRLEKEGVFYDKDYVRSFLKGWRSMPLIGR